MPAPTIMPIGSCRIHNLINQARLERGVRVRASGHYGLIYNTKEIIQQIRYMFAEFTIPVSLRELLNPNHLHWRETGIGETADVYFIEISNPKIIEWEGKFLQQGAVAEFLRREGAPTLWDILWHGSWSDEAAVRERISREPDYCELTSDTQDFLLSVVVHTQIESELMADMAHIAHRLGGERIVFLSKVTATDSSGVLASDRLAFAAEVAHCADVLGIRFFDPTAMLHAFGESRGFADKMHYSSEFARLLGDHLLSNFMPSVA